jgi:hypothetical protein
MMTTPTPTAMSCISRTLRVRPSRKSGCRFAFCIQKSTGAFGDLPSKKAALEFALAGFANDGFLTLVGPPASFLPKVNAIALSSKGMRNAPGVSLCIARLFAVVSEMLDNPNCKSKFESRGGDKELARFVANGRTVKAQVDILKIELERAPEESALMAEYILGLQNPTAVNLHQYPGGCPGCSSKHGGSRLVQQESPGALREINKKIREENDRRQAQFDETGLGQRGGKLKEAPTRKGDKYATLQCTCYDMNCLGDALTNRSCDHCTKLARAGNAMTMVMGPVGNFCPCVACMCVCRLAFTVRAVFL